MSDLKDQVEAIINTLENGFDDDDLNIDDEPMSAMDYIFDALDIEYILDSQRQCIGARILVCFGGPNVWINTRMDQVEGYWWNESFTMSYTDNIGLQDAVIELYECC